MLQARITGSAPTCIMCDLGGGASLLAPAGVKALLASVALTQACQVWCAKIGMDRLAGLSCAIGLPRRAYSGGCPLL